MSQSGSTEGLNERGLKSRFVLQISEPSKKKKKKKEYFAHIVLYLLCYGKSSQMNQWKDGLIEKNYDRCFYSHINIKTMWTQTHKEKRMNKMREKQSAKRGRMNRKEKSRAEQRTRGGTEYGRVEISPMAGVASVCLPTNWAGPSPSRKSLNWLLAPRFTPEKIKLTHKHTQNTLKKNLSETCRWYQHASRVEYQRFASLHGQLMLTPGRSLCCLQLLCRPLFHCSVLMRSLNVTLCIYIHAEMTSHAWLGLSLPPKYVGSRHY